jgi:hypothetical protein
MAFGTGRITRTLLRNCHSSNQKHISANERCNNKKNQEVERVKWAIKDVRIIQIADTPNCTLKIVKENCGIDLAANKVKQTCHHTGKQ